MIKNERLSAIMEILEKEKFCTTEDLSKRLFVVPVTIRRDLKILEREGLIDRCYGGASVITHDNRDVPYIVRDNSNNAVKAELAKRAVALISCGSTVFLDASSTASHIAKIITAEQNLTVVTNSITICTILAEKGVNVYCTGGKMINNSLAFAGAMAVNTISSMNVDYMFFSAQGIDEYGNITDFSEQETELRRAMLSRANKKYFMCDSSKLFKKHLFCVCNIKDIDGIICDKEINFITE